MIAATIVAIRARRICWCIDDDSIETVRLRPDTTYTRRVRLKPGTDNSRSGEGRRGVHKRIPGLFLTIDVGRGRWVQGKLYTFPCIFRLGCGSCSASSRVRPLQLILRAHPCEKGSYPFFNLIRRKRGTTPFR